jgi:chromatin modification-related protein YNG2
LEEIRDKDQKFYETRKRIQQRDNQIHKFIKANGSLAPNPKEESSYPKIRADFEKAKQLQQDKCDLAATGLFLVARQLKKLNDEVKKLESDGLLAPANGTYSGDTMTSRAASLSVNGRSRPTSAMDRRVSPNPISRGSTPAGGRPTKRQKTSPEDLLLNARSRIVGTPVTVTGGAQHNAISSDNEEETLYCTCQRVSFGNMVACDNPDCQYEWFHYECVGLKEPPVGKWFCPTCVAQRKDR